MRIGTILIFSILAALLSATAFMPLLDVNFLIYDISITDEPVSTNFLAIRSATFASLAFFIVNFLRHKRPLSSVAPLLAFCNFLVFLVRHLCLSGRNLRLCRGSFCAYAPRYLFFYIEKTRRKLA